jgi:hypothetical protein
VDLRSVTKEVVEVIQVAQISAKLVMSWERSAFAGLYCSCTD